MSEKKYTVVLLNDGGITSEMINAINVVMGSFNMFLGGSESIRSDGSYILAKDVSEDIAYALKQGIEASGGQVEIFDDKTNTETVTSQQHQDYSTNSSLNHHSQNKKNTTENKKSKIFEEIKKSQKEHISDVDEDKKKVFKEFKQNDTASTSESFEPNSSAPKFSTANSRQSQEKCCSYHSNNKAIMKCDNCGKPICKECGDMGELTDGNHVCFDCANAMVQNDVNLAKEKRSKIMLKIGLGVLGAVIFGIISAIPAVRAFLQEDSEGVSVFLWQVLFTLFGASLSIYFPVLKKILAWIWKFIWWKPDIIQTNEIIDFIFGGIKFALVFLAFTGFVLVFSVFLMVSPVVATIIAVVDFKHYKKADELVKRNQEILQHLADRMEYIRIQSEEKADIETLAHDSRMQDNQFAQSVRQEGYVSASKVFSDEAREMAENDKKIKQFVLNEYGEAVRVA